MEIRSIYGKRVRVTADVGGPSLTKQAFKEECDMNVILKRFAKTGILPEQRQALTAQYGDFSNVQDFQSALNTVLLAQETFDALPAQVRERFGNDPGKLVSFVQDDKNYEEAVKLGLAEGRIAPEKPSPAAAPSQPAAGSSSKEASKA